MEPLNQWIVKSAAFMSIPQALKYNMPVDDGSGGVASDSENNFLKQVNNLAKEGAGWAQLPAGVKTDSLGRSCRQFEQWVIRRPRGRTATFPVVPGDNSEGVIDVKGIGLPKWGDVYEEYENGFVRPEKAIKEVMWQGIFEDVCERSNRLDMSSCLQNKNDIPPGSVRTYAVILIHFSDIKAVRALGGDAAAVMLRQANGRGEVSKCSPPDGYERLVKSAAEIADQYGFSPNPRKIGSAAMKTMFAVSTSCHAIDFEGWGCVNNDVIDREKKLIDMSLPCDRLRGELSAEDGVDYIANKVSRLFSESRFWSPMSGDEVLQAKMYAFSRVRDVWASVTQRPGW